MKRFIAGAMAGAVAMYLLDPDRGRGRRARMSQQWSSRVRSVDRAADRFERDAANRVRGQVASEADIARVVRAINGVPGVHGVESLMHLPGEPAPNKKPARAAGI